MSQMSRAWLVVLAATLIASCSKQGNMSLAGSTSPATKVNLAALATMNEDCLQYVVETRDDGTELWHADYPYFYLMDAGTEKLTLGANGRPMAEALLYRKAIEFMEQHPELESRTNWGVRIARYEQIVRDGKELSRSEAKFLDAFDLEELLKKDAETRRQASGAQ